MGLLGHVNKYRLLHACFKMCWLLDWPEGSEGQFNNRNSVVMKFELMMFHCTSKNTTGYSVLALLSIKKLKLKKFINVT